MILHISCEIALRWVPQDLTDEWLINMGWGNGLVPSHHLSQCWSRFLSPHGITRYWGNEVGLNVIKVCQHLCEVQYKWSCESHKIYCSFKTALLAKFITVQLTPVHADTIWCHRTWSTSVPVMAWCHMTPSHYQNQCWQHTNEVLWHSPKDNYTRNVGLYK